MKSYRPLILVLAGLALFASGPRLASVAGATPGRPEVTRLAAPQFADGSHDGTVVTLTGLTLAPDAASGTYLAPPLPAPFPFNAVFPVWEANLAHPEHEHDLLLEVRTRGDGAWTDWRPSHANHDWIRPGDPDITGEMIMAPTAEGRHTELQFRVHLARDGEDPAPLLRGLSFFFVDSTAPPGAPPIEPLLPETPTPGYPKPGVVPRSQWCFDPACNYSDGLEYVSVTHLVVHHTVTTGTNYPDVVRAIWSFHTFSRGWGDVGYNYLIDPNGVIYEGHLGGDDVVGTHAGNANHGSMGAAMIGDFSNVAPSSAMKDALANLLAWKADQKGIDPFDARRLPDAGSNVDWGLPNLMGHRDVFGGTNTACPGNLGHDMLPWLRQEVANRLGYVSPFLYVEEWANGGDTPIFSKSNANWYTAPGGCGSNRHAYYTFSTTDPGQSVNWGIWRPNIPADGSYEVWVYAPYCDTGRGETYGARYDIHHAAGSNYNVTVNVDANVGLWMNLGSYPFQAGNTGWVYLDDLTTTDTGRGVWFDAIRLRPLSAAAINQAPANGTWKTNRIVDFTWTFVNVPTLSSVNLQAATDPSFSNLVLSASLPPVQSHAHQFNSDYASLHWRVRALPVGGGVIVSNATQFGIDSRYPETQVHSVVQTGQNSFQVAWGGTDATSGISRYNIDVWGVGDATWTRWLTDSTLTSATYQRPDGRVYWFRSQGIDNVGNVEPAHLEGDKATGPGPNFPVERILLPLFDHDL